MNFKEELVMRRYFAFVVLLVLIGGMFFNSCVKKIPEEIVWNESFAQGLTLAQEQGKYLMVEFDKEG